MAYSSGYFTSDDPSYTVEDAQRDKLDLVCRKLGLEEGMRFLDVGCGWGSLSLHAAQHYGAQVTGVTIAAEQKRFIDARIAERGLQDRVEIRLQDYREIPEATGRPAVRRRRVARDGRARRREELRDLRPGAARRGEAGRTGADPADVPRRRTRRPSRRRPVHRVVHRARHAHAPGRRDGGVPRARGAGGARRARPARALRADRRRRGWRTSRPTSTGSPRSSARRSCGSGGSTSSAGRWPSATAGWGSTRS